MYVLTFTNSGGAATGTLLTAASDTGAGTAGSAYAGGIAVGIDSSSALQQTFLAQLKAAIESANGHGTNLSVGSAPTGDGAQNLDVTSAYKGTSGNTLPTEDVSNLAVTQQTAGVDGYVAGLSTVATVSAIAETSASAGTKIELFIASE